MGEYTSRTIKIYYNNQQEFEVELNEVLKEAYLEMGINVRNGTPTMTTLKSCSDVYYYIRTQFIFVMQSWLL